MPLARTSLSIDQNVLKRFNAVYPAGERSRVVQKLIEADLKAREGRLAQIARQVETDAAFAEVRADAAAFDMTIADGLDKRAD